MAGRPSQALQLRIATPADADAIALLHAESWRRTYRGMMRDDFLDGGVVEDRLKAWRERLAAPASNQHVVVADDGGELLGFVCVVGDEHPQWGSLIDNLHVRHDATKRGTGAALMRAAAEWCWTAYPARPIHLLVLRANANALAFYDRLGGTNAGGTSASNTAAASRTATGTRGRTHRRSSTGRNRPIRRPVQEPSFVESARRKQIIDCAIETIAALGYERASLAEIGKCAGISKGNVTYYFSTKDDLIDQVMNDVYARAAGYMLPKLEAQTSARATLRTLIITNVEFIRDHRTAVQALIEIISRSRTADGQPRYDVRGLEQVLADLEHVLRWGQETGEFGPFATPVYAIAIRMAIDALGPRLQAYPDLDVDEYGRELADLFDRATRSEDSSPGGAT